MRDVRDGDLFAVISGASRARSIYPAAIPLAVASSQTRRAARDAIEELWPGDGTAIGAWLSLAAELFSTPVTAAVVGPYADVDDLPDELREVNR